MSFILLVSLVVLVFLVVLLSPVILLILLFQPDTAGPSKKLEKLLRTSLRFQIFSTVFLLRVIGRQNNLCQRRLPMTSKTITNRPKTA